MRDHLFVALGRDHHTFTKVEWHEGSREVIFDPDRTWAEFSLAGSQHAPAESPTFSGPAAFFVLGVEHIFTGFDHILFLIALVLGGGSVRSLLGIVTAFTIAHTTTLGLAVYNVVRPPARIIEPLIAFSIAYVAFENIVRQRPPTRRWLAALLFGLVHGFGFASALIEVGVPRDALVSSLLFFNVGVEAGQAALIFLFLPAVVWLSRFPRKRRAVSFASAAVLTAALALLAQRALQG